MSLNPLDYGWENDENGTFSPIGTLYDIAPEQLLKLTVCNCTATSNCGSTKCSCRNLGMKCIPACGHCSGSECSNASC